MKKKTILITGSSGFIGNLFLKHALSKGYKVIDILRNKNRRNKKLNNLRKKYLKSYKSIFFSNLKEINPKLKNIKIDYFINFATLYKNSHLHDEVPLFIQSNITFPSVIIDTIHTKVDKVINFGTMMQHTHGEDHSPSNFYASTKSAFEMILNFYLSSNSKLKFYNLKFYESYSEIDNRRKLIPTLIKNYRNKKLTNIVSDKLELNIIHVKDIIKAVDIIINKNFMSGNYCLKQPKNINIKKLVSKIDKVSKKKLRVKFLNKKISKIKMSKIKILPGWKPHLNLENDIIRKFKDENSKN